MKVYILYENGGEYDGAYCDVRGVFSSQELAENRKAEIENVYKQWLEAVDPHPDFEYGNDAEFEAHSEWFSNRCSAQDFNYCSIEEVELDNPLT